MDNRAYYVFYRRSSTGPITMIKVVPKWHTTLEQVNNIASKWLGDTATVV